MAYFVVNALPILVWMIQDKGLLGTSDCIDREPGFSAIIRQLHLAIMAVAVLYELYITRHFRDRYYIKVDIIASLVLILGFAVVVLLNFRRFELIVTSMLVIGGWFVSMCGDCVDVSD